MDLELSGKRAGVTGASRGIGLAVARGLVAEGVDVALIAMARTVLGELGGIDILVNCAAKVNTGPMRDEDLDEHLNVKLKGYLRSARAFAPGMAERGWGRIVNVSGLAARQTGSVVGSVRNVAVAAMTKNLADEYGVQGVNAEEVASVIVFLASPCSVSVTGDPVAVGGGARGAIYY